jgi:hypothetical protein
MGVDGVGSGRNQPRVRNNDTQPVQPRTEPQRTTGGNTSQPRNTQPPFQRDEFVGPQPQRAGGQAFAGATAQGQAQVKAEESNGFLDGLQTVLDVAGFIPGIGEVADIANAGISAARGNYLEAGLSLLSVIPGVGDAVGKGAKYALKAADAGAAAKALDLLKQADIPGFFNKLANNPQVAKYVEPLKKALDDVMQKLQNLAGPQPQFAMAGGPNLPSGPVRPNNVNMSSVNNAAGGGFRQGDHLFNKGLQKLDFPTPRNQVLKDALDRFETGLRDLQNNPAFVTTVNKGAHGADLNSTTFGGQLREARERWAELDGVLANPRATAQQREVAARGAMEAMESLRKTVFDPESLKTLKGQMNPKEFQKLERQIGQANQELDRLFDGLVNQIARFRPSPGELGQSLGGVTRR